MALHTIATMFLKSHFFHHAKPTHTKIANSKLASFNSSPPNEKAKKLITFLKESPHKH